MTPQSEKAWQADVCDRLREQIKDREKFEKQLMVDDLELPEYERPLCGDTMKRVKPRDVPWFKYMLP